MGNYFQEEIECAPLEKIQALQNELLPAQVRRVWENVPYYRNKMKEHGVTPDDIKSIDDLRKLPFLTPEEADAAIERGVGEIADRLISEEPEAEGEE